MPAIEFTKLGFREKFLEYTGLEGVVVKPLVCWIIKEYRVKREGGPGVNSLRSAYILGLVKKNKRYATKEEKN